MKKHLHAAALAIALAALTFAPAAGFAANPAPAPNAQQNTPPNATGQEKHPVMRKAINQLQRVREELQNDASRDFDGHRANAVKLIDQAIQQLQQGINSDRH
jgi:hypothetical protein